MSAGCYVRIVGQGFAHPAPILKPSIDGILRSKPEASGGSSEALERSAAEQLRRFGG
jgi:hypothetical protein